MPRVNPARAHHRPPEVSFVSCCTLCPPLLGGSSGTWPAMRILMRILMRIRRPPPPPPQVTSVRGRGCRQDSHANSQALLEGYGQPQLEVEGGLGGSPKSGCR